MPTSRPLRLIVPPAALALLLGAFAGPSPAAQVVTLPCAVDVGTPAQRTVLIRGAGFTPGSVIGLSYTSPSFGGTPRSAGSAQADPAGGFTTAAFPAPFSGRNREQVFGLMATDPANPTLTAATTFRQVRFGVTVFPSRGRPGRIVRYTARGFLPGRNVYAHYRFAGRTRANVRLGRATAPCGKVTRRMRLIPARSRFGTWLVYVDQRRTFSRVTRPQVRASISVSRTFG